MTVEGLGDIEVTEHATVADISALVTHQGHPVPDQWWCGSRRLDAQHRAGVSPLHPGAHLASKPGLLTWLPAGPHVAVVAGPSAGTVVELGATPVVLGSAAHLNDPTVSRHHVSLDLGRDRVDDLGSVNGTIIEGGWLPRASYRWPPGARIMLGHTIIERRPTPSEPANTPAPEAGRISWAASLAGLMGAAMMAAMTGRWWFLLLGALYPTLTLARALGPRVRTRRTFPVTFDPTGTGACAHAPHQPLAIRGPRDLAEGLARTVMVARGLGSPGWDEPWVRWLPQGPEIMLVAPGDAYPSWATATAEVDAAGVTLTTSDGVTRLAPALVSASAAEAIARRLVARIHSSSLPNQVRWADIHREGPSGQRPLRAWIGVGADGPCGINLRDDGPHFLVAGTTGSGKSALLETLVLALAHDHSPADLTMVLVDFKGGAGLRRCLDLPHVAGTLTDLDTHLAGRVMAALRFEVRRRKAQVAEAGHASWDEWEAAGGAPARVLVVMDEYQEMMSHYRDFVPHITTIAAQGRSLGIHIVLSTQRPAGAVTADVRANVATTIALRVTSPAESHDVLGDDAAARLDPARPGRAVIARGVERAHIQVALPWSEPTPAVRLLHEVSPEGPHLAEVVHERWRDHPRASALVHPPLMTVHPLEPHDGPVRVAWADLPDECRQEWLTWDPTEGMLAACGPVGSGRTSLLRALAVQVDRAGWTPVWLPSDPREAARTLHLLSTRERAVLLVDNTTAALGALERTDRGEAHQALSDYLSSGAPVACTFGPSAPVRWVSHASTVVAFHGLHATDAARWTVAREHHSEELSPGRATVGRHGRWCTAQVPWTERTTGQSLVEPLPQTVAAQPGILGVGGDRAQPIYLSPQRPVVVVGGAGSQRDAVVEAVRRSHPRDVAVCDSVMQARMKGLLDGTVLISEPHIRDVMDVVGHRVPGVVDPVAVPHRVVLVDPSGVHAVQVAV